MLRWACLGLVAAAACARGHDGRVVVAVSVDWEGAQISPEGIDGIEDLRRALGGIPITHFVCPAYLTADADADHTAAHALADTVHPGDELALHLHAWASLASAGGVTPKLSPSFFSGTDKVFDLDGKRGYDVDLDVYDEPELRAMVRASRELLERAKFTVSTTFRAGGYLGTPKVLQAISDEGFTVDSSALDHRQIDAHQNPFLAARLAKLWPKVDAGMQPFTIATDGHSVVEVPITAAADQVTVEQLGKLLDDAYLRLQGDRDHDVFVVLAMNQETADELAHRLGEALDGFRKRAKPDELAFTTVERIAALSR